MYVTIVLGLSDSFNVSVKDSRSDILHRPRVRVMLLDHNYSTEDNCDFQDRTES